MDKQLKELINAYQRSTLEAVELLQQSGVTMPKSAADWIDMDIPQKGELNGGVAYQKHGAGCEVKLPTCTIDFDFGKMGEIDEFDLWRLQQYIKPLLPVFGFDTQEEVAASFKRAANAGSIKPTSRSQFYVAGEKRRLAMQIRIEFQNDILPHRDQDEILTLGVHTFGVAELMRKNHDKLLTKLQTTNRLSRGESSNRRNYFIAWIGFLAVTCEGFQRHGMRQCLTKDRPDSFRDLIPKCDAIGKLLKPHYQELHDFRNNVFHLRTDISAILRFAFDDGGRLKWAEEIHSALADFFMSYGSKCELHYLMNKRWSESQIGKRKR